MRYVAITLLCLVCITLPLSGAVSIDSQVSGDTTTCGYDHREPRDFNERRE